MTQKNQKKLIGYVMYAMSIIMPMSNYPQIHQLYSTKVTSGLSLSTWIMYLFFGLILLAYAVVNKLRPLVISNVLWLLVYLVMIFGIVRFGMLSADGSFERLLLINTIGKAINGLGILCLGVAFALFAHDLLADARGA